MVEEDEKDVLEWVACVKQNLLVLCYLHDVKVSIYVTCVSDIIIKEILHIFFKSNISSSQGVYVKCMNYCKDNLHATTM